MRRFRSGGLGWVAAIISLVEHWRLRRPSSRRPVPVYRTNHPQSRRQQFHPDRAASSTSRASATNAAGNNVDATFTFNSSDTSILNIASNGAACAGRWDAAFTSCTPGGTGVVKVTATAQGASSPPTYVFVHPPDRQHQGHRRPARQPSDPGALPHPGPDHDGRSARLQPRRRYHSHSRARSPGPPTTPAS